MPPSAPVAIITAYFNPVQDVTRLVIDAAVAIASRRSGRLIGNWSFPLVDLARIPLRAELPARPRRALVFNSHATEENFGTIARKAIDSMAAPFRQLSPDATNDRFNVGTQD